MISTKPWLLVAALFSTGSVVHAAELELGAGLFASQLPHYAGAASTNTYIAPFPYIRYRSDTLEVDRNGVQHYFWRHDRWSTDWNFGASIAVDSDETHQRKGMDDLGWILEAGPSLNYAVIDNDNHRLRLRVPVRWANAFDFPEVESLDWSINPQIDYRLTSEHIEYNLRLAATYRSERFNRYVYGVGVDDVTVERPAFDPNAGYAGYSISHGLSYRKGRAMIGGFIRYRNISHAEFVDSPLVEKTDDFSVGLAMAWVLKTKQLGL